MCNIRTYGTQLHISRVYSMYIYIGYINYLFLDPTLSLITDKRITVLRGSTVTFECTPSDITLPVRWIFYSPDGTIIRIPLNIQDDSDTFKKRQTSASDFNIKIGPPGLFHRLTVYNAPLIATGIFSCEILPPCPDNIIIAQNTSLTIEPGK